MVIKQLLGIGSKMLSKSGSTTPQLDASLLMSHVLGKNRSYLIINHTEEVNIDDEKLYLTLVKKRADGKPMAYILGQKEFMSLDFIVNENVLIPRADTETLCEYIIEKNNKEAPKVLDICCGSGCIGISLAVYIKDAHVTMMDISERALDIAKENAKKQGISERCSFKKVDVLSEQIKGCFDIVVSNPPYIETAIIDTLERDVAGYEPHLALDGGDDGLKFYNHLAKVVPKILNKGAIAAFEVGYTQADAVKNMLIENGFLDVGSACDLAGIQRVVYGKKA